ncbi:MAG TPA: SbmA/BacA-like family transporter [Xanthobacteraceae bacterium]|jgi:ABC-type uncharacterized transport system fused permease/ATPase subunit
MAAPYQVNSAVAQRQLLRRFWRDARRFWTERWAGIAWSLSIFLVLLVLAQLLVQYLLNIWTRNFFDAIALRDAPALWTQAQAFIVLASLSTILAASSVWGRMTAQRKWREAVTRLVIEHWLAKDRFRQLNYLASGCDNPEFRISEDLRVATDSPVDLVLAFLSSVLTAITFFSILWEVGGTLTLAAFGRTWSIPGYLVVAVTIYSSLFSAMMALIGHRLTAIIERKNQAEAEFRAAADLLHLDAAPEADGNSGGRRALWLAVHRVLRRWRDLCWQLVGTTVVSHANFLLAPVVAWLLCVPKYLAGTMSLGELTQVAAAFVTVQSAFNWLVDNYGRLADWRSSVHRLARLLMAIDALDGAPESAAFLPAADRAGDDRTPAEAASGLRTRSTGIAST